MGANCVTPEILFASLHIFRQNRDLENFWEGEPNGRSCCCGGDPEGWEKSPAPAGRGGFGGAGADLPGSIQPPGSVPDLLPAAGAPDGGAGNRASGRGKRPAGPHHRPPATRSGDDPGSHPPGIELHQEKRDYLPVPAGKREKTAGFPGPIPGEIPRPPTRSRR